MNIVLGPLTSSSGGGMRQSINQVLDKEFEIFLKKPESCSFKNANFFVRFSIHALCLASPNIGFFYLNRDGFRKVTFISPAVATALGITCFVFSAFTFGTFTFLSTQKVLDRWKRLSCTRKGKEIFKNVVALQLGIIGEVPSAYIVYKYGPLGSGGGFAHLLLGGIPNVASWIVLFDSSVQKIMSEFVSCDKNLAWTSLRKQFEATLSHNVSQLRQKNPDFLPKLWATFREKKEENFDDSYSLICSLISDIFKEDGTIQKKNKIKDYVWNVIFIMILFNSLDFSIRHSYSGIRTISEYLLCPSLNSTLNAPLALNNSTEAYFDCISVNNPGFEVFLWSLAPLCTLSDTLFRLKYVYTVCGKTFKRFIGRCCNDSHQEIDRSEVTIEPFYRRIFIIVASILSLGAQLGTAKARWMIQNYPLPVKMTSTLLGVLFGCFVGSVGMKRVLLAQLESYKSRYGSGAEKRRLEAEQGIDLIVKTVCGFSENQLKVVLKELRLPVDYWKALAENLPPNLQQVLREEESINPIFQLTSV